ncbi:chromatin licensing and DNA replication factor 1 protein [Dioscorea alata]|uniref:Chromatin licensing and DNA replication factor 1 protein n=2 Tax=Dioscorea alata TaxID=55571 RepID=A0ACB7WP79_DIOAL|nr:chromatin licensing and DNA replication factor 1 protein [Dioscorea alata]KAH7689972.1 chromatin licensing and DNA replication factor 1 protein [Dioscorea alata]
MENDRTEQSTQTSIKFRCKKAHTGEAKKTDTGPTATKIMGIDENDKSENTLVSQTPEKPEWRSKGKEIGYASRMKHLSESFQSHDLIIESTTTDFADDSTKGPAISEYSERYICGERRSPIHEAVDIPEKCKTLADLFDGMACSIRLLNLCKRATTYQNISTQVEILTKRKFLINHLAQMKYLFPEAIQMEKVLVHDASSLCMKQDLKITLLLHIVDCPSDPAKSTFAALSEAFHLKLKDFFNAQPEVADVPEAILPEPFDQRKDATLINKLTERSATVPPLQSFGNLDSVSSTSCILSSFHKQFSDKVVIPETVKTQQLANPDSLDSIKPDDETVAFSGSPQKKDNITSVSTINPSHMMCIPNQLTGSKFSEGTPTKSFINSDELRVETPALQAPKRALLTSDEKPVIEGGGFVTETKVSGSVRRSLIYSPANTDGDVSYLVQAGEQDGRVKSFCEKTTAKRCLTDEVCDSEIKDQQMRQTGFEKRQEMLACLPNLFNMIKLIFRSVNCSFITKKELIHKIITIDLEIEDSREVEEQLRLLEELVPDWISKKTETTGDFLYSINNTVNLDLVRARLLEAQ